MLGVIIQIDAWDPVAGAAATLRLASHDDDRVCHLDGQLWWPAIRRLPSLRYDFFSGAFDGAIDTPSSSIEIGLEDFPTFARLILADARFRLWTGQIGDAFGSYTLRFDGIVSAQPAISNLSATIDFAVDDRWLDEPLLDLYAGTGGLEGEAGQKGAPKPLALGQPRYAPGQMIDSTNMVLQLSAYGAVQGVSTALERLVRFGASTGNYASIAALIAASIPAGGWGTCTAQGLVRHGAKLAGLVSYLMSGDAAGVDGWVRKPGQLIKRLCEIRGHVGKISEASVDALDAARPWNLSLHLSEQVTIRDIVQRIAASVNAAAGVSWLGQLFVVPIGIGTPAATLRSDGTSLPVIGDVEQVPVQAPYWRMAVQAERTWAVHAQSDIAYDVDPALTAANSALAQLSDIASDGILTPSEKSYPVQLYGRLLAEQGGIDTQATAYGITTEKTNYDNALSALTSYLGTLTTPVAWNNLSGNTTVTGTTFRAKFTDVETTREVLLTKMDQVAGTRANWTGVSSRPLNYRVVAKGNSTSYSQHATGLYDEADSAVSTPGRSYTVVVFSRSTGLMLSSTTYDVFGNAANATTMANALNALSNNRIVCIYSDDEPQGNRFSGGLQAAMYRCGASPAVFGSTNLFKYRSAYVLIGIPGMGEGNGFEAYAGAVDSSTDAWLDVPFQIYNGAPIVSALARTNSSVKDLDFTGDLNATNGAPSGTTVAGRAAADVASTVSSGGGVAANQVNTAALQDNSATAPWYVESSSGISFASATRTEVLSISFDKLIAGSVIECNCVVPFSASDAVDGIFELEIQTSGGTVLANRSFTINLDGNNATLLPMAFNAFISGVSAGKGHRFKSYFTRTTSNSCSTTGLRHQWAREYKK
jgi:hypothetical protein